MEIITCLDMPVLHDDDDATVACPRIVNVKRNQKRKRKCVQARTKDLSISTYAHKHNHNSGQIHPLSPHTKADGRARARALALRMCTPETDAMNRHLCIGQYTYVILTRVPEKDTAGAHNTHQSHVSSSSLDLSRLLWTKYEMIINCRKQSGANETPASPLLFSLCPCRLIPYARTKKDEIYVTQTGDSGGGNTFSILIVFFHSGHWPFGRRRRRRRRRQSMRQGM